MFSIIRKSAALAAAAVVILSAPALAARSSRTPVDALDELYYDGTYLKMTYTVDSRCKAPDHKTTIEFDAQKSGKTVVSLTASVYDAAPEASCEGRLATVVVTTKLDFSKLVEDEIDDLRDGGAKIDPDYIVNLPSVHPPLPDDGHAKKPDSDSGNTGTTAEEPKKPVKKVKVATINYIPAWSCMMRKNDGSSRDGFEGTGGSLDEARQSVVRQCLSTGHPQCNAFSTDPAHTQCDPGLAAKETVAEYDSDKLPEGAQTESWTCTLRKNDGARKDGFTATAATEDEARAQASQGCKRTNNPQCDAYSLDDAHTKCEPRIVVEGVKPTAVWKCTLWKNDGARKDGFEGSGGTKDEAQREAAAGCQRTNNPNCMAYSIDPAHTQCTADFVYPDK